MVTYGRQRPRNRRLSLTVTFRLRKGVRRHRQLRTRATPEVDGTQVNRSGKLSQFSPTTSS